MVKKSNTMVENNTAWNRIKGRWIAKFRAGWRMARAKTFLYIDNTALVGAFSNYDIMKYMEKFSELIEFTVGEVEELKSKTKKSTKTSKQTDSFTDKLNKVTKEK